MKAVFNSSNRTMILEPTSEEERTKMVEYFPEGYLAKSSVVKVKRKVDPYGNPINDSFMTIRGATAEDTPHD
jgi:hypothetical protein